MSLSSLQLWCFNTCTADSLSDLVMMCFPLQSRPDQIQYPTHEAMIGIISFTAIIDNNAQWTGRVTLYCGFVVFGASDYITEGTSTP